MSFFFLAKFERTKSPPPPFFPFDSRPLFSRTGDWFHPPPRKNYKERSQWRKSADLIALVSNLRRRPSSFRFLRGCFFLSFITPPSLFFFSETEEACLIVDPQEPTEVLLSLSPLSFDRFSSFPDNLFDSYFLFWTPKVTQVTYALFLLSL